MKNFSYTNVAIVPWKELWMAKPMGCEDGNLILFIFRLFLLPMHMRVYNVKQVISQTIFQLYLKITSKNLRTLITIHPIWHTDEYANSKPLCGTWYCKNNTRFFSKLNSFCPFVKMPKGYELSKMWKRQSKAGNRVFNLALKGNLHRVSFFIGWEPYY